MKRTFLILAILVGISSYFLTYEENSNFAIHKSSEFSDTLESGSSDSLLFVTVNVPAKYISFTIRQLDTNGVTSPDSTIFYNRILTFWSPVDIKCCQDSVKSVLDFTYATTGQYRSGWVFQPGMTALMIRMVNTVYRTNRRLLVETYVVY